MRNILRSTIIELILIFNVPLIAYSETLISSSNSDVVCQTESKFVCSAESCNKVDKGRVWIKIKIIDSDSKEVSYYRCIDSDCDIPYKGIIVRSGLFTIITLPTNGLMFKASSDGKEFVETASLGTSLFISYGKCFPK